MDKKILFSLTEASPVASPKGSEGRKHKSSNFAKNINSFLQNCEKAVKLRGFLFLILLLAVAASPSLVWAATLGKIATGVGGVVAGLGAVMFTIAGILYVTSAGSPELRATAKKTLIYAIIGMAVGLSADMIVAFIKTVTG